MCVTSPPYWGLRDYGTARWDGGDTSCAHTGVRLPGPQDKSTSNGGSSRDPISWDCRKCGARRVDAQIGLEATPEEFVATMVAVFREVKRVLRDDGTLWLNFGDSYNSATAAGRTITTAGKHGYWTNPAIEKRIDFPGLKPKDLCGMPWRVAFALQADGWYLRSDIIWAKPNPMPESVTDRCTKAHEYLFLLSKRERYYFDQEAILEDASANTHARLAQDV